MVIPPRPAARQSMIAGGDTADDRQHHQVSRVDGMERRETSRPDTDESSYYTDTSSRPSPWPWERSVSECKKAAKEFETDFKKMKLRMHRFPPSLQGLGSRYMVPMAVSIGPYHHHSNELWQMEERKGDTAHQKLREMEEAKRVATYEFVESSNRSFEEVYAVFHSVAKTARSYYVDSAMQGIHNDAFEDMMLRDGCFLLQYMFHCTKPQQLSQSLLSWFDSNQACIMNDIMLLENQLPWVVLKTLLRFTDLDVVDFVSKMASTLQARGEMELTKSDLLSDGYEPPHLVGLLRHYKIVSKLNVVPQCNVITAVRQMAKTTSAIELAEIGIKLTTGETTNFTDLGIKGTHFSRKIFLAPLLLDEVRACWLANMAAYEVCMGMATTTSVRNDTENPAVSSYLAVLAMLMDREEDVHELRSKRVVQGQLCDKDTFHFFKSVAKGIIAGPLKSHIMEEIEDYRVKWWIWIRVYGFFYKNFKTIAAVLSIIGVLAGIFKVLLTFKQHQNK